MNLLKRFGGFWYNFIVGDDWRIAAGVVIGLAIVALLKHTGNDRSWWLFPLLVVATLGLSLWAEIRPKHK